MLELPLVTLVVIFLALIFDFSNGLNDSANAIATVVSTRVLTPVMALGMAVVLNFFGAYMNTHVAQTIGKDIVDPSSINSSVVTVALAVAAAWNILLTIFGMPISASHALIGALVGAVMGTPGHHNIHSAGLLKILLSLLISPPLALISSILLMRLIYMIFRNQTSSYVNRLFGKLQLFSAAFMAFSHGSNDAQKAMGVITMALVAGGTLESFEVPNWVIFICAMAMGIGYGDGRLESDQDPGNGSDETEAGPRLRSGIRCRVGHHRRQPLWLAGFNYSCDHVVCDGSGVIASRLFRPLDAGF